MTQMDEEAIAKSDEDLDRSFESKFAFAIERDFGVNEVAPIATAVANGNRESSIKFNLDRIEQFIKALDGQIERLEYRLEPVLLQPYPTAAPDEKPMNSGDSHLGSILGSYADLIDRQGKRLSDLIDRIDL